MIDFFSMQNRFTKLLIVLSIALLSSCATRNNGTDQSRKRAKVEDKTEKKSYVSKLATGFLEYFGQKQRGEKDVHPARKGWPPKL